MARKEVTISAILQELAGEFDGIVAEREVFDRVLERRPSSAKNPYTTIRQQLRFDGPGNGWVALGNGEIMPLRLALLGLRFRLIPDALDLEQGAISLASLRPFVPLREAEIKVIDQQGATVADTAVKQTYRDPFFGAVELPAFSLRAWFTHAQFELGDSILATIIQVAPLVIEIAHERAADFQAEAVAAQEHELLDGLAEMVNKGQRGSLFATMTVLPMYARASWRTAYPGRPWQLLVEHDSRMRLVTGDIIASASFRTPFEMVTEERDQDRAFEDELFQKITTLQAELLDSRRDAVKRGLWDGTAPRVSTAQTLFDFEAGTSTTVYPGAVNALEDHTAAIEEHIANGDYEENWALDDDMLGVEVEDGYDEFEGIATIDDVQLFIEQNPEVAAATRRLMESLTPAEQQRLDNARSIDDVQQVLGPHLADLLRTEPALFVPLTPDMYEYTIDVHETNGNGHDPELDADLLSNEGWEDDADPLGTPDVWLAEDEESDELFDGEDAAAINAAVEQSSQLLDQFVEQQLRAGKSKSTATARAGDLWLYADFLSRYYGRSLELGDYATLDECLFFFYPRKVLNSSTRNAREFCTSVKQFYGFLKAEQLTVDDGFAVAIWQRREQAARVVDLYEQIDSESPQFERLFAHLFAPYTA